MIIENNCINELIINKSRFITYLYKVHSKEDINNYLINLKKEYKDATHICYAYILDNNIKFDDDNEPSGTAGLPIVEVWKKNNLNHVICIVIRYFGGIKLGAGGLVRAYTKSATECLKKGNITILIEGYRVQLTIQHSSIKQVDYLLKDYSILKKYDNNIIYEFSVSKDEFENIKNSLIPYIIEFKIINNIYVSFIIC